MDSNNVLTAADTVGMQAGDRSFADKAVDAFTAGTVGAALSAWASWYNTGVSVVNTFGGQAEQMNVADTLAKIDTGWSNYYLENKDVIDTAGFIAGSFVPGGLALKGLQLARTGEAVGAFGRALGYTRTKQIQALESGLSAMANRGSTIYNEINTAKLTSMAWGVADNALQAAVFETAVAATMKQSPLLADSSWGDMLWEGTKNAMFGGVLGGSVTALLTNGIYRQAGKAIEAGQRKFDTLATMERMGLTKGDEYYSLIDAVTNLPKEVEDVATKIPFKWKLNGVSSKADYALDITGLAKDQLAATKKYGLLTFQAKLTNMVAADPTIAKDFSAAMANLVTEGLYKGADMATIKQVLGDNLFGLKAIEPLGAKPVNYASGIYYLDKDARIVGGKFTPDVFTTTKTAEGQQAYRVNDALLPEARVGVLGIDAPSIDVGFKRGYDVLMMTDGKLRINPDSKVFAHVSDTFAGESRTVLHLRTNTTFDDAIPAISDVVTKDIPLRVSDAGVSAGKYIYAFEPSAGNFQAGIDSLRDTARNLWTSKLSAIPANTIIDARDFAVLDRMLSDMVVGTGVKIRQADGTLIDFHGIANKQSWLTNAKVQALMDWRNAPEVISDGVVTKVPDPRALAYKLNTELEWIQQADAVGFDATKLNIASRTRPAESYLEREHSVLVYDGKIKHGMDVNGTFQTGHIAYLYRTEIAQQTANEAAAAVLRGDYDMFVDLTRADVSGKFQASGTGASGFGSANADYGDLPRLFAQDTGKGVSLVSKRRADATLQHLQAPIQALQDNPKLGAELGAVLAAGRRADTQLTLFEGEIVDLAYVQALRRLADKGRSLDKIKPEVRFEVSPEVYDFLSAHQEMHKVQLQDRITLANAMGTVVHHNPEALYFPPIDTRKLPYFAFVRQLDGTAFGTSEVSMITAATPEKLRQLIAGVKAHGGYEVINKDGSELYHKALGDYEYSRALNKPVIDSDLRKAGVLSDTLPNLDGKTAIEDFINYHIRTERGLTRDAVSVRYGNIFAELSHLSKQHTSAETSKLQFVNKLFAKTIADPFGDIIRTALNISKKGEYTIWNQLNEFVDALGTRAYSAANTAFADAKAGNITWEEANAITNKYGIGTPFTADNFVAAQTTYDRNLARTMVSKGNMLVTTLGLTLDAANSLLNIVSTPILLGTELASIRSAIKGNSELVGKLNELTTVADPATKIPVPSTLKLLFNAARNYFTPEGKALVAEGGRYKQIGVVKELLAQHHAMMEDLAIVPTLAPTKAAALIDKLIEKGSVLTGNQFAEQFTRFVSANVMHQLTDPLVAAGKMSVKEQNAYMSIFTNRVQGNYIASQRPIAFQGTVGAAVGLFQTYSFNLYQQLFRHIENRDLRAVATFGALQTTMFGLNGLPMFDAINSHLIGTSKLNPGNKDAYSFLPQVLSKEVGDWLLYGTPSAFPIFGEKMPALYTRGDLNPRNLTILPINPADMPFYNAGSNVVKTLATIATQVGRGSPILPSLLFGLEHNGVSRPLAGVAQVLQGFTTTSKGNLVSSASDFSAIATASRFLGARPMDEAVMLNTMYRLRGYTAADKARLNDLGSTVKMKIRNGDLSEEDILDLQAKYAAAGGRMENFGAALQRWQQSATMSVANTMLRASRTPAGQRLAEIMGADGLEDSLNIPVVEEPAAGPAGPIQ